MEYVVELPVSSLCFPAAPLRTACVRQKGGEREKRGKVLTQIPLAYLRCPVEVSVMCDEAGSDRVFPKDEQKRLPALGLACVHVPCPCLAPACRGCGDDEPSATWPV